MKYRKTEAEHLYRMAREYQLNGAELLADADVVMRECNGVGADWMPDSLTVICTKMVPVMEVPAAIHDLRYAAGVDRLVADTEFLGNVMRVIELTYAWYDPRRYINRRRATRFYTYLRAFGGRAWEEARKRYGN